MTERDWLTQRFAEHRGLLMALACRMLGSRGDAEDAMQEAWLRVSRADGGQVENPAGWLTTVVARVCLNMLESPRARRGDPAGALPPEPAERHASLRPDGQAGPEDEALLVDAVGAALMVVLDTLAPAERLPPGPPDVFGVSFSEIGAIIDRSPVAARQLASRARRRVQGAAAASDAARSRKREMVAAFLAASRGGDFGALLTMLDPDAVLVADPAAVQMGAAAEVRGADAVGATFAGWAKGARLALADGVPAAVWAPGGRPKVVFTFTISDGKVTGIALDGDPDRLREVDVVLLSASDTEW